MMFRYSNEDKGDDLKSSYMKNYESLLKDINLKEEQGIGTFNDLKVFKYKKLILKYDSMPNEETIKGDIDEFLNKVSINDTFKVFNIKGNVCENTKGDREYVLIVSLINMDINK